MARPPPPRVNAPMLTQSCYGAKVPRHYHREAEMRDWGVLPVCHSVIASPHHPSSHHYSRLFHNKYERIMTSQTLPIVGAALRIEHLEQHRDWLIAQQRDLEIQNAVRPEVLDSDWRPLVRQARAALDGYTGRLGIHGPFLGLSLTAEDAKIRALVAERMRTALAFAAELGATHMVVHSPFSFFGHPMVVHSPNFRLYEDIQLAHATLETVLPVAQQANCTLMIETIYDTNPTPLLTLVRSFESEHVRLSIDTGHVFIGQRVGGPPPDHWVSQAGALLGHVHLQDSDSNADRHWAPGDGTLNWFALFLAIQRLEQRPRLILELRDPAQIGRAMAWLGQRGLAR